MIRYPRVIAILATIFLLTGCGSFPTSGPVVQVGEVRSNGAGGAVDISPASPVIGGDPETILAGFLVAASSTSSRSLEIAREYLTSEAAQQWAPNEGSIIFDGYGHSPITTQSSAILQSPVVGRLSADGHYSSGAGEQINHNFGMTQVDGEWRISNPGTEVFLSRSTFERSFRAIPVHFLDLSGTRTVVENVYYAAQDHGPALAIASLLRGPSAWLRPAVMTVVPAELKNSALSVHLNSDGFTDVSLGAEIETLSADQRVQLAAQIVWTLAGFPEVRGVRILVADQLFTIRGQDSLGVLRLNQFLGYRPTVSSTPRGLAVIDSRLVGISPDGAKPIDELGGTFGKLDWGDRVGQISSSIDGAKIIVTNESANRLYSGSLYVADPATLVLEGTHFTDPQFDERDTFWVVDNQTTGVPLLIHRVGDSWIRSPIQELSGSRVLSFSVSPDETRLAVVFTEGGNAQVGMLRIRGVDQLIVDGLDRVILHTARGVLNDAVSLGWASDSKLMILGSTTEDEHRSVYSTDTDGAVGESIGPIVDVDAVGLAVWSRTEGISMMLHTGSGRALKFEDRYQWAQVAEGVSVVGWSS